MECLYKIKEVLIQNLCLRGIFRDGHYNKNNYICNLFSSGNEFDWWFEKKTERFKECV